MEPYRYCPRCATELVAREDEGRERPSCPACGFVQYLNPLPIVAAIVEHEGDVLLVRSHGWPETWYGLVAGFLEQGETPEDGILREIEEELDLEAALVEQIGLYSFTRKNQLIVAYHARAEGLVTLGPELADYRRVPPDELKPWPFGTGPAVRDWLARR